MILKAINEINFVLIKYTKLNCSLLNIGCNTLKGSELLCHKIDWKSFF